MKKFLSITALAAAFLFTISSCKKDDHHSADDSSSSSSTTISGNWKVILYNNNGTDDAYHYTGYTFQFATGGPVTATNGSSTVSGTWSNLVDDSQLKLILNFGTTATFQELNHDWHVIEQSSTLIRLEDISGGSGGTEYLTFQKI